MPDATPIHYAVGDATQPTTDGRPTIICQVVNDAGRYGAGFSGAVARRWPFVASQYRAWHAARDGDDDRFPELFRLGAVQVVAVQKGFAPLWVANMVAQQGTRSAGNPRPIRYDALRECLESLRYWVAKHDAAVAMPLIGTGLAGGSWVDIKAIVRDELTDHGVHVTVYELKADQT